MSSVIIPEDKKIPMQKAQKWIEELLGIKFQESFHEELKSGVKVINAIYPGMIPKISNSSMPFHQRENIVSYLSACKSLGLEEIDCFVTQNLFEGDNMGRVIDNIHALGANVQEYKDYKGPAIGVKKSQKNIRVFNTKQMINCYNVPSKWTMGSYKEPTPDERMHLTKYATYNKPKQPPMDDSVLPDDNSPSKRRDYPNKSAPTRRKAPNTPNEEPAEQPKRRPVITVSTYSEPTSKPKNETKEETPNQIQKPPQPPQPVQMMCCSIQ